MQDIQKHWQEGELPGINSVVYGDGKVTLLNIYNITDEGNKKSYAFPIADTDINSLVSYNDDIWAEIQIHPKYVTTINGKIFCGEGAMGNEGFIALSKNDSLVWSIFSTESNPFKKLELYKDTIIAYSDFVAYHININNPVEIDIKIL